MKIKEKWEYEQIKNNPEGFKKFLLSRLDTNKNLNIYKNNVYPINCSNRTKQNIQTIRDEIFSLFEDKDFVTDFENIKTEYVENYVTELLQDIELFLNIKQIIKNADEKTNGRYKYQTNDYLKYLAEKNKSLRNNQYLPLESIFVFNRDESKHNKNDNFTAIESKLYIEQWEHVWFIYATIFFLLFNKNVTIDKLFKAFNNGKQYNQSLTIKSLMRSLISSNNDSTWNDVYLLYRELWMIVKHQILMIDIKEQYE